METFRLEEGAGGKELVGAKGGEVTTKVKIRMQWRDVGIVKARGGMQVSSATGNP